MLIDSWECRSAADELNYYELTITVFPAATDTAPEVTADTASAVTKQKDSLFGELGDTLSDAWKTVQEATDGATAVLDSITGIFDDIYNAIENIDVLDDVNQLLSALAAATSGVLTQALDADNTPNSLNRTPTLSTGQFSFGTCDTLRHRNLRKYQRLSSIRLRQHGH